LLYRLSYLGVLAPSPGRASVAGFRASDNGSLRVPERIPRAPPGRVLPAGRRARFPGNAPLRNPVLPRGRRSPLKTFLALCIVALPFPALAQQPPQPPPVSTPGAETPGTAAPAVMSPGNARWAASPDEAKARAAAEGKFVYVEFDAPDCGHCQRMDTLLYPAFQFEAVLLPMVPVKVALASPEGRELARRYGIRDTPAVLVTTAEGRLVFLMQGFTNAPEFYRHIQQDTETYRAFAKRIDAQDISRLPAREALDTGRELYQRSDPGAALPRLKRAATAASPAVRDEAREILAAVELDLGQHANSKRTIDRLLATTKDARRRERAELFRAQLPLAENRPAEALALFRKFQRDHPNSPYIGQVNEMLARLTQPPSNP
jgi:thiol-disulfide isomerase/thioredoxin